MRFRIKKWFGTSGSRSWTADLSELPVVYDAKASKVDIYYCFRLILGRLPDSVEWSGHSARAGTDLAAVVASYVGSLEFSRRNLGQRDPGALPVKAIVDGRTLYVYEDDEAVGRAVLGGAYEAGVTRMFKHFVKPGMRVLDIGANIGYFTVLAAALVGEEGHVYAIEPNPENAKLIEASRRENQLRNVTLYQLAAGRSAGLLVLNTAYSNGTTAEPSDDLQALLQSVTVPSVEIDKLLSGVDQIDFLKIDIEGAEYNALVGAEKIIDRFHPTIVSEFSPSLMPGISGVSGSVYLQFLLDKGYNLGVVQHDGKVLDCGLDPEQVLQAFRLSGVDHIDILATHGTRADCLR